MAHGSQALFTQAGFNDPSQDDSSQNHYGVGNANALQSQVSSFTSMFYVGISYHDYNFHSSCQYPVGFNVILILG